MNLCMDASVAEKYRSPSQRARVITEGWVASNMYCPVCGNISIVHFENNQPVADFFCPNCSEQFEVKSKNGDWGTKIADGAYETFISRITSNTNPNFFLMNYSIDECHVKNLCFVPKFFLVPESAEQRKPLSSHARKAGWVGCNILYDKIPLQGRIPIVKDSVAIEPSTVLAQVKQSFLLKTDNLESRGWMFDVLHCINEIIEEEFELSQIYQFEKILELKYNNNRNIRAKIRQQLQKLRDRGVIEFLGNGRYRKV